MTLVIDFLGSVAMGLDRARLGGASWRHPRTMKDALPTDHRGTRSARGESRVEDLRVVYTENPLKTRHRNRPEFKRSVTALKRIPKLLNFCIA
jgi:hypothetical protein